MRYYCSNNRCSEYALIEEVDGRVSPRCPSCDRVTLPLEDEHLAERVFICCTVFGIIGGVSEGIPGSIFGAFVGLLLVFLFQR